MYSVDSVVLSFIDSRDTPTPEKSLSIALVSEQDRTRRKRSLAHRLKKAGYKVDEIYTWQNPFTVEDGAKHDLIIAVRGCDAERLILKSCRKYNKQYILVLCLCGGYDKVIPLIQKYNVPKIYAAPSSGETEEGTKIYEDRAWFVLHNLQ